LEDHRELGFQDQIVSPKATILSWQTQQNAMSFSVSSLPLGENNPRTLPIWTVSGEPKHRYLYRIPLPPLGTRYRLMPPTQPLQCPTRYLALPIPNLLLEVRNMNNWVWKLQASS
jgi:hypothetical protein